MAKGKPPVYTGPNPSGKGWVNKVGGEVISNHHKKTNAVERGRKEAIERTTEQIIANKDGKISEKNSYGNDPRNIPG